MPNTLVRAAAEGLPAINRRRMLLGLAAASTAAAAVTVATPAPAIVAENPELVRLGDQLPAALAELEAAREAVEWIAAEWKHRWPLAPDIITLPNGHWDEGAERDIAGRRLVRAGERYCRLVRSVKNEEACLRYVVERKLRANATAARRARKEKSIASLQRELEICKAYHAETGVIREASGIGAALARVDLAKTALVKLSMAIINQPEMTMGGLLIKAQAITTITTAGMRHNFMDVGPQIAASIIRLAEGGVA